MFPCVLRCFNPRSRVRSDLFRRGQSQNVACFNPRSRVRSDTDDPLPKSRRPAFQSTLPCKERPNFCLSVQFALTWFQSTLPCKERPLHSFQFLWNRQFQSTLPCKERRAPMSGFCSMACFNPRSRARSDLQLFVVCFQPHRFQSTLPCKERHFKLLLVYNFILFQSTLPCKERQCFAAKPNPCRAVSIHAPVQGATLPSSSCNPSSLFQSTLPCKERQKRVGRDFVFRPSFNPRSRARSDDI